MPLEQQVTSLIPSQRLKELGIPQKSLFYWIKFLGNDECVWYYSPAYEDRKNDKETISAFTVAELGEMLPNKINDPEDNSDLFINIRHNGEDLWCVTYTAYNHVTYFLEFAATLADAIALMLIYLLEQKLIQLN